MNFKVRSDLTGGFRNKIPGDFYKRRWSEDPYHTGFRYCQMEFGQVDSTWKLSNKNT